MLKYQVWKCDECGKETQSDGFPKDWIEIRINKGDYFHKKDYKTEVDKDCCCQTCANKAVLDYYSAYRVEFRNESSSEHHVIKMEG